MAAVTVAFCAPRSTVTTAMTTSASASTTTSASSHAHPRAQTTPPPPPAPPRRRCTLRQPESMERYLSNDLSVDGGAVYASTTAGGQHVGWVISSRPARNLHPPASIPNGHLVVPLLGLGSWLPYAPAQVCGPRHSRGAPFRHEHPHDHNDLSFG
ncbi:hypothetical protein DFH08DRAFT_894970 [Mycena albidolilacea]|uniref:Uncharacterized protein n=1 Tax=Mycena albidolilacea TaxID=1033008 RepID=A0AAD6ZBL3_9AGAR|nr:hypothetical protein DFH08DRAFT_894970 [Mycena albidolilacea]